MKQFLKNEFFLLSLLFFLLILVTIFQSINQDYTSIIDFDLTVIHNSLQLVSNQFPDFVDHTAYSQFLTIGAGMRQLHEWIKDWHGEGEMIANPDRIEFQSIKQFNGFLS